VTAVGSAALSLLLGIAALAESGAEIAEPVRVRTRPELPWTVAILAVPAGEVIGERLEAFADQKRPPVRALVDAGGRLTLTAVAGGFLAQAEGPPEAAALVIAAARSCAAGFPRGALFVEGRAGLGDRGALHTPKASAPSSRPRPAAAGSLRQPLAPAPGLFDLEGEALALFVEEALAGLGAARAGIVVDRHGAALLLDVTGLAAPAASARAALAAAIAAPLPSRQVEALRTRALGRLSARRAPAGGWARDAGRMWLAFGAIDAEDPPDLSARIRARLFPAALFPEG
jgi:hypothetical protein